MKTECERKKELQEEEEGLSLNDTVGKTIELLEKIMEPDLLRRVYRFVQYIYIHRS